MGNNKRLVGLIFLVNLFSMLVGCNNKNITKETSNQISNKGKFIEVTSNISQLEDGLYVVKYEGDYKFDDFLENKGASSDEEVMRFLSENILIGKADLKFKKGMFACSTLSVVTPDGEKIFGRNFDWKSCNALIVKANPKNGYQSISTVNMDFINSGTRGILSRLPDDMKTMAALYAPLDGMNEKGFAVSVNMIRDNSKINQNTNKDDITTTTAIRLLLDKAASVNEAIELMKQYDMHSSMGMMIHFAISDIEGNSAVIEYINNEMNVVDTPVVTNFYLSEGEKYGVGTKESHTRYEMLMKQLDNKSSMDTEEIKDAMDSVSKHNFSKFASTEWTAIFNQTRGEVTYYHRENYQKGYSFLLK